MLGIGAGLAAISILCLAILLPALRVVGFESAMLTVLVGFVGAGLVVWALRKRLLLGGAVAAAIVLLLVLATVFGSSRSRARDQIASDRQIPEKPPEQAASPVVPTSPTFRPPAFDRPPQPAVPSFTPPEFSGPPLPAGRGHKSELVGGTDPGGMFQMSISGAPITGIAYQLGDWAGQPGFRHIQPLRSGEQRAGMDTVFAKEGYGVGGFVVDTGPFLHALQIVFMRIHPDGRLAPEDSYKSEWIGTPVGATQTVASKGEKVIGIHGRRMALIHAVGLILE